MISSKTVKLFLLGLVALSLNPIFANDIDHMPTRIASGVRGTMRLLQDDIDSADDDPSSSSQQMESSSNASSSSMDDNNSNSSDDDNDRNSQRFVAPRARQCTTGKSLKDESCAAIF